MGIMKSPARLGVLSKNLGASEEASQKPPGTVDKRPLTQT